MVRITLGYFGALREARGLAEEDLALPYEVSTIAQLKTYLEANYQLAGALSEPTVRTSLNDTIVTADTALKDGDVVDFLPLVTGG